VVILLEMLLTKYQTITFIEQQCLICHDSPMTLSVLDCGCRLKYIAICPNFQANNYTKSASWDFDAFPETRRRVVMMLGSTQAVANKKVSNILSQVCGVSFISFKQASKPKHREVSNLNTWNFFHRRDIASEKQSLCKIHRNVASCDRSTW
jgi:hypothetical protein